MIKHLKGHLVRTNHKHIDTTLHTVTTKVEAYEDELCSMDEVFKIQTELSKVIKLELMLRLNPQYEKILGSTHT